MRNAKTDNKDSRRAWTILLTATVVGILFVTGADPGGASGPGTSAMVYEKENNDGCNRAVSVGNVLGEGDTHVGNTEWRYAGGGDTVDYWDIGHPGKGVTFHAHFAAASDKVNDVLLLHGLSDHSCGGFAQGTDCGGTNVGLGYDFSCELRSNDHYFLRINSDNEGRLDYQVEEVRFEPVPPDCEEGKDLLEQLIHCDLPL